MTTSQQPAGRHQQQPSAPPAQPYPGQIPAQWNPRQGPWPQQWPDPQVPQQWQAYPPPFAPAPAAPRNGLGTAALVLGIVGALFGLVPLPITGVLAFLLGVIGLVLGPIGLSRVRRQAATNRGVTIAGIILSALAIVFGLITIVGRSIEMSESSTASSSSATASTPTVPSAPIYTSPPTVSAPAATDPKNLTTGMYEVGADIPAGKYKTTGPVTSSSCYFERSTGDGSSVSDIVDNDNIQGPGMFTAKAGETLTLNGDCVWSLN